MSEETAPFLAIGNDELGSHLAAGDMAECPNCGEEHEVMGSTPVGVILTVRCNGSSYLVGVKNRSLLPRRKH